MNTHALYIINHLKAIQNPEKAKWLERYVKHNIQSLGVGIPQIREIVQAFGTTYQLSKQPIGEQIEFLDELMKQDFTEPKLAAILFIQQYWKSTKSLEILHLTSKWFDKGWVADWNVCDWLCVRLLSPLVDKEAGLSIPEFSSWNSDQNLWKARASLVPFAQCKSIDKYPDIILKFSQSLIKRDERFCKTAVGWVLRQYSKSDATFVIGFLEKNKEWATKEVIKNATKYL